MGEQSTIAAIESVVPTNLVGNVRVPRLQADCSPRDLITNDKT